MASSVKNVLDSLTHQVLVESLFGPGCIHLRQLRLQVAIVRVFFFPGLLSCLCQLFCFCLLWGALDTFSYDSTLPALSSA